MTPFRQAAAQMKSDFAYQAFLDFARTADVAVMLDTAARLMRGQYDPYHTNQRVIDLFFAVHELAGWGGVLELIADVQKEKEA